MNNYRDTITEDNFDFTSALSTTSMWRDHGFAIQHVIGLKTSSLEMAEKKIKQLKHILKNYKLVSDLMAALGPALDAAMESGQFDIMWLRNQVKAINAGAKNE